MLKSTVNGPDIARLLMQEKKKTLNGLVGFTPKKDYTQVLLADSSVVPFSRPFGLAAEFWPL